MINWRAMQAYKGIENPDANIYHMGMGSWHANLSKGSAYWVASAGASRGKSGKVKITNAKPPKEGWPGGDPRYNGKR